MSFKGIDPMQMKMRGRLLSMAVLLSTYSANAGPVAPDPVVGTWLVEQPAVPFPLHLYVFNADYTMQQANPDAGNPRTSDSDGKGAWARRGMRVSGKWVEIMADRTTHKLTGRGEFSYQIEISGDRMTGTGTFYAYDPVGKVVAGPISAPFTGSRVTAP